MTQMFRKSLMAILAAVTFLMLAPLAQAQQPTIGTLVTPVPTTITVIPITATATAGSTSTLTIPTPNGGLSNYVCSLAFEISNNNTGTALNNVVSTSTNFNSFAVKTTLAATNSADSGVQLLFNLTPALGCVKSTIPGTATTFVSSVSPSNAAWSWYATYYQAP